jgi:hypothetical protein
VRKAVIDIELSDGTRQRYEVDKAVSRIQTTSGFTRSIAFIFDEPSMVRELPPTDPLLTLIREALTADEREPGISPAATTLLAGLCRLGLEETNA